MTELNDVVRRALRAAEHSTQNMPTDPLTGVGILGPGIDEMVFARPELDTKAVVREATDPNGEWIRCERDLLADVEAIR